MIQFNLVHDTVVRLGAPILISERFRSSEHSGVLVLNSITDQPVRITQRPEVSQSLNRFLVGSLAFPRFSMSLNSRKRSLSLQDEYAVFTKRSNRPGLYYRLYRLGGFHGLPNRNSGRA